MSSTPWERWINAEEVHNLYHQGIERYGGTASVSKDGCIDGALGAAYSAELYTSPEVDGEYAVSGLCFCGSLLFYLATKHCFVDGNKRVAWLSSTFVLLRMGLTLDVSEEEAVCYCVAIASGSIRSADLVIGWIAEHLQSVE